MAYRIRELRSAAHAVTAPRIVIFASERALKASDIELAVVTTSSSKIVEPVLGNTPLKV